MLEPGTQFHSIMDFMLDLDDPYSSVGYEHFCCEDCLDDE